MIRTTLLGLLALPSLALATLADCNSPELWRVLKASTSTAEAGAVFMDHQRIRWPGAAAADSRFVLEGPGVRLALARAETPPAADLAARHAWLGTGTDLQLPAAARRHLARWLQGPLLISERTSLRRIVCSTPSRPIMVRLLPVSPASIPATVRPSCVVTV